MALNQGPLMTLIPLLTVVSLGLTLVHTGLIVLIWQRHEATRDQTNKIDRRLSVLEAHLSVLDQIERRQNLQGEQLSALMERTNATLGAVVSIQEYLRDRST